MLSIANEVDPLIFRCVYFVCDTNMCFSNSVSHNDFTKISKPFYIYRL